MNASELIRIEPIKASTKARALNTKILLVKPPFFTPWTPPLGISILKSFLEPRGYSVKCFDFNTDIKLWTSHHKYFAVLQKADANSGSDGYSKLWFILNAHYLAYFNGADRGQIARLLENILPLFGINYERAISDALIPIVEGFFQRMEEVIDDFDLSDYSVVGTSTYTTSLSSSLFFLRRLKERYPHIKAVMGGGVFADDLALGSDNLNTLLEEYPFVDHVVLGEGEMLFLKLLEGDFAQKRVISIADLKGATLEMKDVPEPDFTDMPSENYYHLTIEGARSCPFQCSFCSETIQWGDYRKKPIDIFARQVVGLAEKYGNNSFFLGDSLMNPYINPFAGALIEQKANILYDGYLRADKPVTNRKFVKMWRDSGLYRARLGIESASARVLASMDKMTTPRVISDVLKTLANSGVRTTTYWIVGFQGETEDDFRETCEFIREHHQYIYELEAHPYYYYPYGQIGSRLHQSYSLYPEEVVNLTRFKIWEVVDANPTREERFRRLRVIAGIASELGIPNIYTMAERYVAEDRWHLLHPQTAEIYEGTRLVRDEVGLPDGPIEVFAPEWRAGRRAAGAEVVCYRASAARRLDAETLAKAAALLVENNETLQLGLFDGKYEAMDEDGEEAGGLVAHYQPAGDGEHVEVLVEHSYEELSARMSPERGSSVRVALIDRGEDASELLLLVHRAVADGRSAALLLEDLFRLYETLSNGADVTLRPLEKTYADFAEELEENGLPAFAADAPAAGGAHGTVADEAAPISIPLDETLKRRLAGSFLEGRGMKPAEVFAAAALRCLSKSGAAGGVDVVYDYRWIEPSLKNTAGALTAAYALPSRLLKRGGTQADARDVREALAEAAGGRGAPDAGEEPRVLLNLEYLHEEPWLGGYDWAPFGYVGVGPRSGGAYALEVVPVLTRDALEVRLWARVGAVAEMAAALRDGLAAELRDLLESYEQTPVAALSSSAG